MPQRGRVATYQPATPKKEARTYLKPDMGKKTRLRAAKRLARMPARRTACRASSSIDQTAPRLAVMRDDIERRRLIDVEVRRVRWMLKRELPRALRRMRAAGGKAGE